MQHYLLYQPNIISGDYRIKKVGGALWGQEKK